MQTGTVCYGDCLKHMKQWIELSGGVHGPGLADLIYFDPPFNSNAKYNILFEKGNNKARGHTAQETAFRDIWEWSSEARERTKNICGAVGHLAHKSIKGLREILGESGMLAYLTYMAERIALMKSMLKQTGTIYLHCDPTASHYLKIVMDNVFGSRNFLSEIIWNYGTPSGGRAAGKKPVKAHDVLLAYTADYGEHTYNRQYLPYSEKYVKEWFRHTDESGRKYQTRSRSGRKYRTRSRKGKIVRQYLDESPGVPLSNVWSDIMQLYGSAGWFAKLGSDERTGYPTQKPEALLERIIKVSSNKGDIVLDPFCGCGTTMVAAAALNREFVGCDISLFAIETVTSGRLYEANVNVKIKGIPEDFASAKRLAKDDPFDFESWAIEACHPGMMGNKVQRKDGGVDGTGLLLWPTTEGKKLVIAQVKAGKPTIDSVRAFANRIQSKEAAAGVFITLEKSWWTDGMQKIADEQGAFKTNPKSSTAYPVMQHWYVKQLFNKKYNRLPYLPELADPWTGKEMIVKQEKLFRK